MRLVACSCSSWSQLWTRVDASSRRRCLLPAPLLCESGYPGLTVSATPQVGYLKPNYLPPYRKLWSPPSNAYVCYLHLTQTDCEYPGYGQAELPDGMWPCLWNASVAQPMRPCVSMVS